MDFKKFISIHKISIVSIAIGIGIALWHFEKGVLMWNNPAYGIPENAYISWLGGTLFFSQSYWFYLIFPLLASIATGIEYGILKKNKYFYQYRIRMGKARYTMLLGFRIFAIGFLVIAIPLALNFILTMMVKPLLYPDSLVAIGPYANEIGAKLFYSHPMVYTIGYIIFDGIFAGTISLFTAVLCNCMENYFLAVIVPYGIYYALVTISNLFAWECISLNMALNPGHGLKGIACFVEIIVFTIATIFLWIIQGAKEDN